tara:strand:- start:5101 stop:6609 length:1509 start_codon:yes stop_codon:yes gene_type:complete
MAYIINTFNGNQLVVVEDGTVDQTTDIKLIGKNFSGYGEAQNENFLHLLEHFANTTAPAKAITGQVWYDAGTAKLKFYTGNAWKNAGGAEVAATEPAGLAEGDLWYSTTSSQLYAKNGAGEFILVGPQAAGDGTTQMLSVTVVDTLSANKSIIIALINDTPVYVISSSEFTLGSTQPADVPDLTGFTGIRRGITLINTDSSTGVTTGAGTAGEPVIWGTASDSLKLGGLSASDFLTSSTAAFSSIARFADVGFTVGNSNDLAVSIVSDTIGQIQNTIGDRILFGATRSGVGVSNIISIRNVDAVNTGIFPETSSLYNIGSATLKFSTMYADTFNGQATEALALDVAGTARSASTLATPNTIAARDSNGDITARLFSGTATQARYADLAEKYTTAEEHPVGTVMTVGGAKTTVEAVPAKSSDIVIGVISENPAYLMNSDIDGQAIALKGRVPVRVKEPVAKGQAVYAWSDGVCTVTATRSLVGVALETNTSADEKLVECVLKT